MELDPYPWLVSEPVMNGGWAARERLADPGWTAFWDPESEKIEFRPRWEYEQNREAYA